MAILGDYARWLFLALVGCSAAPSSSSNEQDDTAARSSLACRPLDAPASAASAELAAVLTKVTADHLLSANEWDQLGLPDRGDPADAGIGRHAGAGGGLG